MSFKFASAPVQLLASKHSNSLPFHSYQASFPSVHAVTSVGHILARSLHTIEPLSDTHPTKPIHKSIKMGVLLILTSKLHQLCHRHRKVAGFGTKQREVCCLVHRTEALIPVFLQFRIILDKNKPSRIRHQATQLKANGISEDSALKSRTMTHRVQLGEQMHAVKQQTTAISGI